MSTSKNNQTSATTFSQSKTAAAISYIPDQDPNFVPFGSYNDVEMIIASGKFFPFQLCGLSGCGKTLQIEQACAATRRELVRAPITIETDEDSLIGHYILENGDTYFQYGPVVVAMLRGAVLLLDEFDKASSRIMCLQPVLEGKPLLIKKTNELIYPAPGFNVCSTANTKGQGAECGYFCSSNVMDEAFLERFAIAYDCDFPDPEVEKSILTKVMGSHGINDTKFAKHLTNWAENIRNVARQGNASDLITTRRLVHIVNAYAIMTGGTDRLKAIRLCLSRFNRDLFEGWIQAYEAIDGDHLNQNPPKKSSDIAKSAFTTAASDDDTPW